MALIKYNGDNFLYFNFKLKIMPGVNEVSESVLDALLNHPIFKHRFDTGILEVIERENKKSDEKSEDQEKSEAKKKKSVKEMKKIIDEIYSIESLEKILETEDRIRVMEYIDQRVDYLSHKAEDM